MSNRRVSTASQATNPSSARYRLIKTILRLCSFSLELATRIPDTISSNQQLGHSPLVQVSRFFHFSEYFDCFRQNCLFQNKIAESDFRSPRRSVPNKLFRPGRALFLGSGLLGRLSCRGRLLGRRSAAD